MSRYYSYLNSAKEILSAYHGTEPFPVFIKKYFSLYKKFGSTDRKQIAQICYCYFRMGKALPGMDVLERILLGIFLCSNSANPILEEMKKEWNERINNSYREKLDYLGMEELPVFPWMDQLSKGVDWNSFNYSFLVQPDLFIRLRPGKEMIVEEKLRERNISFRNTYPGCLALANNTKLELLIDIDREIVIQDQSSQRVGDLMKLAGDTGRAWDSCAGSGGKSILYHDIYPEAHITASDDRPSILANLVKRFDRAGIRKYEAIRLDLTKPVRERSVPGKFSLIIADVPCTGSGTWSRNPEQLFNFEEKNIQAYVRRQQKIISRVIPFLEKGGMLLYITCSVFEAENEGITGFICDHFPLQAQHTELITGYNEKADTLFASLLKL